MKLPFPGETWVLTFSNSLPGVKPLEIIITDADESLVWFYYTDHYQVKHSIATPTELFPTLYTYVRGSQCHTQNPAKKSFFSRIVSRFLRYFSTSA